MTVELGSERLRLGLVPERGGGVAWFDWLRPEGEAVPLFRRADAAALASGDPSRLACFPLIPFANRIEGSRFTFRGREHRLPVNRPPNPTAIHGSSFQASWQVAERTGTAARLVHRHEVPGSPFRYEAEQVFGLDDAALRVTLAVTHRGDEPLPYGIGLHPFLPRRPGTRLALRATTLLPPNERLLPTDPRLLPPELDLAAGRDAAALAPLDACLAGWDGRATVTWPSLGCGLGIEAEATFPAVHVFAPPDRAVLCVEPVSHVPNVHNRPDLEPFGALRVLERGETLRGAVTFRLVVV